MINGRWPNRDKNKSLFSDNSTNVALRKFKMSRTTMKPTIVIALGGNALLRRGQVLSYENQLENVKVAAESIAKLSKEYRIAIVHGNGPQVGLLSQQNDAFDAVPSYPLSCLVAESQGMIATMLAQELRNRVDCNVTTILTHVDVDKADPAFNDPTKFIGQVYSEKEAYDLAEEFGWSIRQDGDYFRRVVASPAPKNIRESELISLALQHDNIVICCGGGGIPVCTDNHGITTNIDCVIDKDSTASLLSQQISADYFLILTDGDGVFFHYGKPNQIKLDIATTEELKGYSFDKGSMQPKIDSMINYVENVDISIGIIADLHLALDALNGTAGTKIVKNKFYDDSISHQQNDGELTPA